MDIRITFPGGKKVNAEIDGMVIETDQPVKYGGGGSAPTPYAHFLASLGTCAGIFILGFCEKRNISTDGISLNQRLVYVTGLDGKTELDRIVIDIIVPPGFPDKYHNALVKVADQCAVKKTIMNPPKFEINTIVST
jgi:ribosomal protein S12 methylthiotransferase accessory factor